MALSPHDNSTEVRPGVPKLSSVSRTEYIKALRDAYEQGSAVQTRLLICFSGDIHLVENCQTQMTAMYPGLHMGLL